MVRLQKGHLKSKTKITTSVCSCKHKVLQEQIVGNTLGRNKQKLRRIYIYTHVVIREVETGGINKQGDRGQDYQVKH